MQKPSKKFCLPEFTVLLLTHTPYSCEEKKGLRHKYLVDSAILDSLNYDFQTTKLPIMYRLPTSG